MQAKMQWLVLAICSVILSAAAYSVVESGSAMAYSAAQGEAMTDPYTYPNVDLCCKPKVPRVPYCRSHPDSPRCNGGGYRPGCGFNNDQSGGGDQYGAGQYSGGDRSRGHRNGRRSRGGQSGGDLSGGGQNAGGQYGGSRSGGGQSGSDQYGGDRSGSDQSGSDPYGVGIRLDIDGRRNLKHRPARVEVHEPTEDELRHEVDGRIGLPRLLGLAKADRLDHGEGHEREEAGGLGGDRADGQPRA